MFSNSSSLPWSIAVLYPVPSPLYPVTLSTGIPIRQLCLGLSLLLTTGMSIPAAAQTQASPMTAADRIALRQALADADAGRSQQAEPVLRRLAHRYPQNDQAAEALGLIYAENGSIPEALPYLERACRTAPRSAVNHANLGTAWLELGKAQPAAEELKTAARLDPRNPATLSALGQAEMLLQDPAGAAAAFGQAAALQPAAADLLYNWAVALADAGQTQRAADVLDRIPENQKTDQAESLAGDLDERLGLFMKAVTHDRRAAELNPSAANLYALCVEFLRHWTWTDAQKTAEYGVARYPDSAQLQVALGVALYGQKHFPQAAHVFALLLQRAPDSSAYAGMLGRTCTEMAGTNPDCLGIEDFARNHPGNEEAAVYAARQILDRPHTGADLEQAGKLLENATAADPRNAEAWYETGRLDAEWNQWQGSADALQKASALHPDDAAAHYQLANAYGHLGRPADRKRELALYESCSKKEKDTVDEKVRAMTVFLTAKP
jgi:predicted Zn-dependent protease